MARYETQDGHTEAQVWWMIGRVLQSLFKVHSWHGHTAQRATLGGENHCSHPFHFCFCFSLSSTLHESRGWPLRYEVRHRPFLFLFLLFCFVSSLTIIHRNSSNPKSPCRCEYVTRSQLSSALPCSALPCSIDHSLPGSA